MRVIRHRSALIISSNNGTIVYGVERLLEYIGKHKTQHTDGPGSLLVDAGRLLVPPYTASPHLLLGDDQPQVYVKYGYAKAYFSQNAQEIERWGVMYCKMQAHRGRTPDLSAVNKLIDSMRHGYNSDHPIPVDRNLDILDGSHRLAICLALGLEPKICVFDKYSRPYKHDFSITFDAIEMDQYMTARHQLTAANARTPPGGMAFIWAPALVKWDDILSHMSFYVPLEAAVRFYSKEEFALLILAAYAADGISKASALRKIFTLSLFPSYVGVIACRDNCSVLDCKNRIRRMTLPSMSAYHYDSIIHTVDSAQAVPDLLKAVTVRRPSTSGGERTEVLRSFIGSYTILDQLWAAELTALSREDLDAVVCRRFDLVIISISSDKSMFSSAICLPSTVPACVTLADGFDLQALLTEFSLDPERCLLVCSDPQTAEHANTTKVAVLWVKDSDSPMDWGSRSANEQDILLARRGYS